MGRDEGDRSKEYLLAESFSEDEENVSTFRPVRRWNKRYIYLWSSQVLFFLTSLAIMLRGIYGIRSEIRDRRDLEDHMPMWSPALEVVRTTGHYQRFDGSFAKPNKFKGPPSPSIDTAWESITYANGGVISISEDTLHRINGSEQYSVELLPELGGGYMASVEVLHQLHCLNMLRQASYWDYYQDKAEPWRDSPQTLRYHLDHCVDNLRQKLMCEADAGILTYVWVKDHPAPFPDFNVQHKCRSFDAVKNWVTENQLFTTEEHRIQRVPGFHELENPP